MTEQEIALANAKGLETRRRRWEQRNEKKRLAALAAEEARRRPRTPHCTRARCVVSASR